MEGFGIPIIESLHSGTPVITIGGGCLQEAGGLGAIYSADSQPQHLAEAISKLLSDTNLRQQLITDGHAHVQKFTPKSFADGIMEVYGKLL
jgi:glycosyltransferase involved in cell wall biosynthesis